MKLEKIKAKAKELADKAEETLQKGVEKTLETGVKVYNFFGDHPMLGVTSLVAGVIGLTAISAKANEFQDRSISNFEGSDEGNGDSVMELLTNLSDNINLKHGEGVFIEGNETGGNTICHYEKNLVLPEEEE